MTAKGKVGMRTLQYVASLTLTLTLTNPNMLHPKAYSLISSWLWDIPPNHRLFYPLYHTLVQKGGVFALQVRGG